MDLEEIEEFGLALGPKPGVIVNASPEARGNRGLEETDGYQRFGVGGLNGLGLPAGPVVRQVFPKGLEVEQPSVLERVLRLGNLRLPQGNAIRSTPRCCQFFGGAIFLFELGIPLWDDDLVFPVYVRLILEVVGKEDAPATIAGGE